MFHYSYILFNSQNIYKIYHQIIVYKSKLQ